MALRLRPRWRFFPRGIWTVSREESAWYVRKKHRRRHSSSRRKAESEGAASAHEGASPEAASGSQPATDKAAIPPGLTTARVVRPSPAQKLVRNLLIILASVVIIAVLVVMTIRGMHAVAVMNNEVAHPESPAPDDQ